MTWFKRVGALAAGFLAIGANSTAPTASAEEQVNAFEGLRGMALGMTAAKLGLDVPTDKLTAYGVIMDMGVERGTATLVAYKTGDASLYLSTGGGVIGGFAHEAVKNSALAFVRSAQANLESFSPAKSFEVPANGQVRFYVLTNRGVLTASEPVDQINAGKLTLSPLWFDGQRLLTEVRLISNEP